MRYSGQIITLRNGIRVKQVNKTAARKAYNEGKKVWLNPCNLLPVNLWTSPCEISNSNSISIMGATFEIQLSEFKFYNCDSERGKYANLFVEV